MERPAAKGIKNPTARPFSPINPKPWNGPRADSLSTSEVWEARSIFEAIDSRGQGSAIHQPIAEPASTRQPIAEPASFGGPLAEKPRHIGPISAAGRYQRRRGKRQHRRAIILSDVRPISRCGVKHPISGGARRPADPERKAQEGAERPETPHCARRLRDSA
jgi:hypothetical protein